MGVKRFLTVALIYISLVTNAVDHLFIDSLALGVFSSVKYLFICFVHYSIEFLCFSH